MVAALLIVAAVFAVLLFPDRWTRRRYKHLPVMPGHPESLTRPLPRAEEEWLAALDARLFPEEAQ